MSNTLVLNERVEKIIFYYILLGAMPLFLANFLTFISPGTTFYSVYIHLIYVCLPIVLSRINQYRLVISYKSLALILLVLLMYIISSLNHYSNEVDASSFINTIILIIGLFTFICLPYSIIITPKNLESFMKKIIYFVIFSCLYNFFLNYDLILTGYSNLEVKKQFASFLSNRNTFGLLLVIGITATTFLIYLERKVKYLFVFLLFFINLIWTNSTNSIVSVLIFFVFFFWLYYKKKYLQKTIILLISIVFFLILLSRGFFEGILNFLLYGDVEELNGRTGLWSRGLEVFYENILFGIGVGQSSKVLNKFENDSFHNGYLEILVSGGIMLFLVYIILIVLFLTVLVKIYRYHKLSGSIYLAAFISLIFNNFFESLSIFSPGYFSGIITIFYFFLPLCLLNFYREKN